MENLTLSDFQTTVVVLLAIFAALTVIDKGIAAFKNMFFKGGDGMDKRLGVIEEKQARDYARINDMNKQMRCVNDDMEHLLNAINSILMHEITGNGIDKLKESKSDLDTYMAKRGARDYSQKG